MGEIFKVPQKAGQIGRPPHVKVVGAKIKDNEPEIVGAAMPGEPKVLDQTTKQEQAPVEIRDHTTVVRAGDTEIRQVKPKPGEPEVRSVVVDPEWEQAKNAD